MQLVSVVNQGLETIKGIKLNWLKKKLLCLLSLAKHEKDPGGIPGPNFVF